MNSKLCFGSAILAGLVVTLLSSCSGQPASCGPANCTGCCEGNVCVPAASSQSLATSCGGAVGRPGQACINCTRQPGFTTCLAGTCVAPNPVACSAATCPQGCCTTSGADAVCMQGTSATECGKAGAVCSSCGDPSMAVCSNQACVSVASACSAATCPQGCCTGTGADAICVVGTSATRCGTAGKLCDSCNTQQGEQCLDQACRAPSGACNSTTCPQGCCSSAGPTGVCLQGTSTAQCGLGGGVCGSCNAQNGESCVNHACSVTSTSCNSTTCPQGCCSSAGPNGVCVQGTSTSQCGFGGAVCGSCNAQSGETCVKHACSSTSTACNATTCSQGCCVKTGASWTCVPGTAPASCGSGGSICGDCTTQPGTSCVNRTCKAAHAMGDPCGQDSECSGLGAGAVCRKTTSPGGVSYPLGYCTLGCTSVNDPVCGTGGFCVDLTPYGEDQAYCVARCSPSNQCRPNYACYGIGTSNGCWLTPLPATSVGPPADKIGAPCAADTACRNPPTDGFCFKASLPDGGTSGFPGGYCSAQCTEDSHCGPGAICTSFLAADGSTVSFCQKECPSPGSGQGNCRTGYACAGFEFRNPDGGSPVPSPSGICQPHCSNPGTVCAPRANGAAGACNATTGECLP